MSTISWWSRVGVCTNIYTNVFLVFAHPIDASSYQYTMWSGHVTTGFHIQIRHVIPSTIEFGKQPFGFFSKCGHVEWLIFRFVRNSESSADINKSEKNS